MIKNFKPGGFPLYAFVRDTTWQLAPSVVYLIVGYGEDESGFTFPIVIEEDGSVSLMNAGARDDLRVEVFESREEANSSRNQEVADYNGCHHD